MVTWVEMGDEHATDLARTLFLRTSRLGRRKTRELHEFLVEREGLHFTSELAARFGVHNATILRRLRSLLRHGLVRQVKGEGRTEKGGIGGRDCDLWAAVEGATIEGVVARVVEQVTLGQHLAREASE